MNLPQKTKLRLLRLIGVPVCLITLFAPCARAQVAPVATADAGALARYDANRNGRLDPEEAAARDAAQTSSAPVNVELAPRPAGGGTLVLSPFEVVSENKGYFSANSMSGTRMNSKIEDLGQSITVTCPTSAVPSGPNFTVLAVVPSMTVTGVFGMVCRTMTETRVLSPPGSLEMSLLMSGDFVVSS